MIKILVACPIKADATSYYRGWGVLNHLQKTVPGLELIDVTVKDLELSWAVFSQAHILFLQRPSTIMDIQMMEIAKSCNIPIWIDYDDDYFNIPETNPRHELYAHPHRVEQLKTAIKMADKITVSTIMLKESIIQKTGKSKDAIQVIPNGIDETIFDISIPGHEEQKLHDQRDIVLWRGGDTHEADISPYLDKMVQLYNLFPEYKWAFFGHAPEEFLKRVDNSRVMLYAWEDVMVYFDRVCELRPKVTIVPWEKNAFNESKSNCSFLESTAAGAATVFPKWSTEFVEGMFGYTSPDDFYLTVTRILADKDIFNLTSKAFVTLQRFSLAKLNSVRKDLIESLIEYRKPLGGFRNPKYNAPMPVATDKEFFDYTHAKMLNQDHEHYLESHAKVVDALITRFEPQSVIEIGCGPGPTIEVLLDRRVKQVKGFDINPYFKQYFDERNPHYAEHYILADFSEANLSGVFDLAISIEVFEHIPAEDCDKLIAKMANNFKRFYFSSTPYRTSKTFDTFWGHINVRTHEHWIATFEKYGWKYVGNPKLVTKWDHLFESMVYPLEIEIK